ncbi:MAG: carboxymuconolactone decarboxylase family protein [Planctomycetes bacterium]|nr:carboxymuconolactone decarboxylase family protein [Planctomycetota bacterium]
MEALQRLAAGLPETAKDIRLNLTSVLQQSELSPAQRFGTALAVAWACRQPALAAAIVAAAGEQMPAATAADAQAAAALMAMNNVYYRFRHMVAKPEYEQLPPRLRMQRLAAPAGNKVDFELFALAVSAVNGCATCVQAHERVVTAAGLTAAQVHDAVRIAAVVHATATTLAAAQPVPA